MLRWDESVARWFSDAAEYTSYAENMAALLLKYIRSRGSLCDVGCGTGAVTLELAKHIDRVTCVDAAELPLDTLRERADYLGLGNVEVRLSDALKLEGRWDTVLGLFFGNTQAAAERLLSLAADRLILVTHAEDEGVFGPEGHRAKKPFNAAAVRAWLGRAGLEYVSERGELEYGQPLRDMDEARRFALRWSPDMSEKELEAYLASSLVRTEHPRWSLYLPGTKRFEIFCIDKQE